jgi:hypothetical protein
MKIYLCNSLRGCFEIPVVSTRASGWRFKAWGEGEAGTPGSVQMISKARETGDSLTGGSGFASTTG